MFNRILPSTKNHPVWSKRLYSKTSQNIKLPINSIDPISHHNVCATGIDSIVLTLPKRNETEVLFDKSKELYLDMRKLLLPQFEGKWLLASVEPFAIYISTHEFNVRLLKQGLPLSNGYYDCLGCEVLQRFDDEDDEISTTKDEE